MKENPGLDFVQRTLRTTGVVLLVILLPSTYYFGIFPALAVFSGGVWGMINLLFLSALVRNTIRTGNIDKAKALGLLLVKFPLLYFAGYCLLMIEHFQPVPLVIGFSMLLVVMVLKVVARSLLGMDNETRTGAHMRGAA